MSDVTNKLLEGLRLSGLDKEGLVTLEVAVPVKVIKDALEMEFEKLITSSLLGVHPTFPSLTMLGYLVSVTWADKEGLANLKNGRVVVEKDPFEGLEELV